MRPACAVTINLGQAEALLVSTLLYSVSITMNIEYKFNIHSLTVVAAALASIFGCELGIDFVSCSRSPVSCCGEIVCLDLPENITQKLSPLIRLWI
jgi:hypothetical protein